VSPASAAITIVITGLDPVIHALLLPVVAVKDVDSRDIGERKRRRSSNDYARPWRNLKTCSWSP